MMESRPCSDTCVLPANICVSMRAISFHAWLGLPPLLPQNNAMSAPVGMKSSENMRRYPPCRSTSICVITARSKWIGCHTIMSGVEQSQVASGQTVYIREIRLTPFTQGAALQLCDVIQPACEVCNLNARQSETLSFFFLTALRWKERGGARRCLGWELLAQQIPHR